MIVKRRLRQIEFFKTPQGPVGCSPRASLTDRGRLGDYTKLATLDACVAYLQERRAP
jgi:hypothetical protein